MIETAQVTVTEAEFEAQCRALMTIVDQTGASIVILRDGARRSYSMANAPHTLIESGAPMVTREDMESVINSMGGIYSEETGAALIDLEEQLNDQVDDITGVQPENDLAVLQAQNIPDDLVAATMRSTADLQPVLRKPERPAGC